MTIVNEWYSNTLEKNMQEFVEINGREPDVLERAEIERESRENVLSYYKLIAD